MKLLIEVVELAVTPCNQPHGRDSGCQAAGHWAAPATPAPQKVVDFPRILAYAKDADEFVRQVCRDHTGWRRDEWAYGPLFICGKFPDFGAVFYGVPGERWLLAEAKERWQSSWKQSGRQRYE
jgi:hypothetical protein